MSEVKIVTYEPKYAADFARLNYEWIEKYFSVERHDREILDDPQASVINAGGQILMAIIDAEAVGTVALIPASESLLELTKMAVSPSHQGQGIGDALMSAAVEYGRAKSYREIFLETHHKLAPAIGLYRKYGFKDVSPDPNSQYSRADVRMTLIFDNLT